MASNAKALSFLSGDLSLSGTEVSINVAGSVQSDSITGSTITMKNTGSTIVASDGSTTVLSESGGTVTIDVDVSTIGSATISGGSITGTEIDLKSSGTTIFASDGTTAVLSESGGTVTLTADEAVIEGSSSGDLVRITQTGTGNALVVEDSSNPDSTPFVVEAGGLVGIGTSSPTSNLEISASTNTGVRLTTTADSTPFFDFRTNGTDRLRISSSSATGATFNVRSNQDMQFYTNNTPRMRIDSSGNLLVGTTSAVSNQGVIQAKTAVVNGPGAYSASNTNYNSGNSNWTFGMNGLGAFVVYINPGVGGNSGVYLNAGATSWTGNSDERLKDITGNIENAIDSVQSLRAVKYTLKADNAEIKTQRVGLIAQDVQAVLPEIIDEDQDGYLGIRYAEITTLLVAAIQEQQTLIESQQSQIDNLTAKTQEQDFTIASLISRIEALENA